MCKLNEAITEYNRLCRLIGKPPYGDCQLVALMLHLKVGGVIVRGCVVVEDGEKGEQGKKIDHFWLEIDGQICDPLARNWKREVISWLKTDEISPEAIINDLKSFLEEFPEPSLNPLFPLRWKVTL